MTSHVCGHLHPWRAVSTLRWGDRRQVACLRALVGNCLRPDDASMSEWKYECLYVIFGNSSVVQCILSVHHFCCLPTGYFWIQLFFPHCHIQSGKKCWEPMFSIVRLIKITSDSLDSILVLHRSHWSDFRNGFKQIMCRFCLCTILFVWISVRTHLVLSNYVHRFWDKFFFKKSDLFLKICLFTQTSLKPLISFMPRKLSKSWNQKSTLSEFFVYFLELLQILV